MCYWKTLRAHSSVLFAFVDFDVRRAPPEKLHDFVLCPEDSVGHSCILAEVLWHARAAGRACKRMPFFQYRLQLDLGKWKTCTASNATLVNSNGPQMIQHSQHAHNVYIHTHIYIYITIIKTRIIIIIIMIRIRITTIIIIIIVIVIYYIASKTLPAISPGPCERPMTELPLLDTTGT